MSDRQLNQGDAGASASRVVELEIGAAAADAAAPAVPPEARVLVYYVTPDGETVSDSVRVDAAPCLENEVRRVHHQGVLCLLKTPGLENHALRPETESAWSRQ